MSLPDSRDPPEERTGPDWLGEIPLGKSALGGAAPRWSEEKKGKKLPPVVRYVHEGNTGRYFCLSNGLVVKHSNETGAWICLYSVCLHSRKYADCIHVSISQDYARSTPPEPVQHDETKHPFPEG